MSPRATGAAALDEGLPRTDRILSRADFLRIQRQGVSVHTPHFVLVVLAGPRCRLGVTASRKVGGSVRRNRVKRLVREVFRRNRAAFPRGADLLVVARSGAAALDYAAARAEITAAAPALTRALRDPASSLPR